VPLAPIVADVLVSEMLAAEGAGLRFVDEVPPGLTVRADAEQLHRVLSNLVRNARQAIVATGGPGEIRISAQEADEGWTVVVRDSGPGLPPKAREHLFQAFQGGTRKGGSGLGLAISEDLVRGHGGRLTLLETGAGGTAFAIYLPRALVAFGDAAE
jgi:hypothetical protein